MRVLLRRLHKRYVTLSASIVIIATLLCNTSEKAAYAYSSTPPPFPWSYDCSSGPPECNDIYPAWQRGIAKAFFLWGSVTREEFYAMLARSFGLDPVVDENPFSDYSLATSELTRVLWVTGAERGVSSIELYINPSSLYYETVTVKGYTKDSSGQYQTISYRVSGPGTHIVQFANPAISVWLEPYYSTTSGGEIKRIVFTDGTENVNPGVTLPASSSSNVHSIATPNEWVGNYYPWVVAAYKAGWLQLPSDRKFNPKAIMTRQEAFRVISKVLGYDTDPLLAQIPQNTKYFAIVSRFDYGADWPQIPNDIKDDIAVLIWSNILPNRIDYWSGPWIGLDLNVQMNNNLELFSLLHRASTYQLQLSSKEVYPSGYGPTNDLSIRLRPRGYGWTLTSGSTLTFQIYRVEEAIGGTAYWSSNFDYEFSGLTLVASIPKTVTTADVNRGYVEVNWQPSGGVAPGLYFVKVPEIPGPIALFEVKYAGVVNAGIDPAPAKTGEWVRITAAITHYASKAPLVVSAELPTSDNGGGEVVLRSVASNKQNSWSYVTTYEGNWFVPADLPSGRYRIPIKTYFSDGSTSVTDVELEIVGGRTADAETLTDVCSYVVDPVWAKPGERTTVGCVLGSDANYELVEGSVAIPGRGEWSLEGGTSSGWFADIVAPSETGAFDLIYNVRVRDDSGRERTLQGRQLLVVSSNAGAGYCTPPNGITTTEAGGLSGSTRLTR